MPTRAGNKQPSVRLFPHKMRHFHRSREHGRTLSVKNLFRVPVLVPNYFILEENSQHKECHIFNPRTFASQAAKSGK